MTHVRVRLRLRRFRLEYEGAQAFFERIVDPLLERVAPSRHEAPVPAPPPATAAGLPAGAGAAAGTSEAAAAAAGAYRPPSHEFGQFVQKLGNEAAEPDRQIVAFVFFLWNYAKKDAVTEEEVAGCFRAIGLKPPPEAAASYADLSQRLRFLQPGPAPGTWSLTTKGANYVKTRLLGAV